MSHLTALCPTLSHLLCSLPLCIIERLRKRFFEKISFEQFKKDIKDDKCIILDPNGLKSFIALNDSSIISVFLSSDEQMRYERMIVRKDSIENAKKRIINDRITFADANLSGITHIVNSDLYNIDELTEVVYKLYMESLGK